MPGVRISRASERRQGRADRQPAARDGVGHLRAAVRLVRATAAHDHDLIGMRLRTSFAQRVLRVALLIGCVALAGCGAATAPTAASGAGPSWDPCAEIPDAMIGRVGLDPASERRDIAIAPGPKWAGCGWSGASTALRIFSADRESARDVREAPGAHDFAEVTVAGRAGVRYRPDYADPTADCGLAFTTATGGQIRLRLDVRPDPATATPACDLLTRTAEVLVPVLP